MLKTVSIAGIAEQGVPYRKESIALEEAAQTLSIGNLTWIECVVDAVSYTHLTLPTILLV